MLSRIHRNNFTSSHSASGTNDWGVVPQGCPVGLDDLSHIQMSHWGFDGEVHTGQLIVAGNVAELVKNAFKHAYNWRFAIERGTVSHFDGDDNQSMAANNTSAFNCRAVTGGVIEDTNTAMAMPSMSIRFRTHMFGGRRYCRQKASPM